MLPAKGSAQVFVPYDNVLPDRQVSVSWSLNGYNMARPACTSTDGLPTAVSLEIIEHRRGFSFLDLLWRIESGISIHVNES
jgi:hypothetical protein